MVGLCAVGSDGQEHIVLRERSKEASEFSAARPVGHADRPTRLRFSKKTACRRGAAWRWS